MLNIFFYGGQWIIVSPATIDKIEQNIKVSVDLLFKIISNINNTMDWIPSALLVITDNNMMPINILSSIE